MKLKKGVYIGSKYIGTDGTTHEHICFNCKHDFRTCCPDLTTRAVAKCPNFEKRG